LRLHTAGFSPLSHRKNWSSSILHRLKGPRELPPLDHLLTLTDDVGVIQHALEDVPNRSTGYCTDDVSRAYMVALEKLRVEPQDPVAARLAQTYLSFLHDAQIDDGRFHNFMGYDRVWQDTVGTHDSVGRALWSLGYGMRFGARISWRRISKRLFNKGLHALEWLHYPRAQAYAMLGLAHACQAPVAQDDVAEYRQALRTLAGSLKEMFDEASDPDWPWFENVMTYDNARLPEAMLRAGTVLLEDDLVAIGLRSYMFCERVCFEDGIFVPVGNEGWYPRGREKARYSQQPLEAASMVDAALAAHEATGEPAARNTAQRALDWYYGRNTRGIVMVRDGGCLDGLNEVSVNGNMGAESTLAHLMAAYALAAQPVSALAVVGRARQTSQ
jgi:hypothetical protein